MSKLRREVLLLCATLCALGASPRESHAAKVDFLWVIDNSPSMAGEQAVLSAAADDIGNQLATARCAIDWRMAVAYTDLHLQPGANDVCSGAPGPGRRRLCPFTTDLDVFRNGTPQCAYVKAGTCGDGSERGFNSARVAIDRFAAGIGCEPVPGGDCTLRPDAQLAVIFMTDTGEQTTDAEAPPAEPDNSVLSGINYFSDYDVLRPGAQRALVDGLLLLHLQGRASDHALPPRRRPVRRSRLLHGDERCLSVGREEEERLPRRGWSVRRGRALRRDARHVPGRCVQVRGHRVSRGGGRV